jgi:hypothetical protein
MRPWLRSLRIAVSGLSLIGCLLLSVLWVRSYTVLDVLSRVRRSNWVTAIGSESGSAYIVHMYVPNINAGYVEPLNTDWGHSVTEARLRGARFDWAFTAPRKKLQLPYYALWELP